MYLAALDWVTIEMQAGASANIMREVTHYSFLLCFYYFIRQLVFKIIMSFFSYIAHPTLWVKKIVMTWLQCFRICKDSIQENFA